MPERFERPCIACGQVDTHPRCQVSLQDGSSVFFHIDCHAQAEPPCPACAATVADPKARSAVAANAGGAVGPLFLNTKEF